MSGKDVGATAPNLGVGPATLRQIEKAEKEASKKSNNSSTPIISGADSSKTKDGEITVCGEKGLFTQLKKETETPIRVLLKELSAIKDVFVGLANRPILAGLTSALAIGGGIAAGMVLGPAAGLATAALVPLYALLPWVPIKAMKNELELRDAKNDERLAQTEQWVVNGFENELNRFEIQELLNEYRDKDNISRDVGESDHSSASEPSDNKDG